MGVYGGRKEIMECVSPSGKVYQAGTLSGNPVATEAGIATLSILMNHPEIYKEMEKKAEYLAEVFRKAIRSVCVNKAGSLLSVFFTNQQVTDFESAKTSDTGLYGRYFHSLLRRGIYMAPSQFEIMFLSAAHSWNDIDKTCCTIYDVAEEIG